MRTTNKVVIDKIRGHILSTYKIKDLISELDNLSYINTSIYKRAEYMVQGGCFMCYYSQVNEFIKSLELDSTKKYSDKKTWELYKHLIARECEKLYFKEVK